MIPFFEGPLLASARAGNVIGGGDWSPDRLIPDILRAIEKGQPAKIRNPSSIRPWQHVLEPLSGYLLLAQRLYRDGADLGSGWNFGPRLDDTRTVEQIVQEFCALYGEGASWRLDSDKGPHEAHFLALDCSKAYRQLGWSPKWSAQKSLEKTVEWYRVHAAGEDVRQLTLRQIDEYESY